MRIDDIVVALQKRREAKEAEVFKAPPQDYNDFTKRLGIWIGLGEALSLIQDARKADNDD